MSALIRATRPVASWAWVFWHDTISDDLHPNAEIAVTAADVLQKSELLVPEYIELEWFAHEGGPLGLSARVRRPDRSSVESFVDDLQQARPAGHPLSYPGRINWLGSGYWVTDSGEKRREPRLASASLRLLGNSSILTIGIYHDIWTKNDFYGVPHLEIWKRNAPRLAASLKNLEEVFGEPPEPEESTKFAVPTDYGADSFFDPDGEGIDVSEDL